MLLTALTFFQQRTQTETDGWYTMVLVAVFGLVFYFVLLRPQLKQQKDQREMTTGLKKGDKVITSGGIWGEVDTVEAHAVRLKVNEKTKITISKSAISGHQPSAKEAEKEKGGNA